MTKKYQINIDRLEITNTASEEIKEYLANKEINKFEFNSIILKRTPSRQYEKKFAIVGKDYDDKKGVFDRNYGYLHFCSPNLNRPNIYVLFEIDTLYDEVSLASRFWIEEVLRLEFLQISKLDVAVDFSFNIIRKFYQLYKNPRI